MQASPGVTRRPPGEAEFLERESGLARAAIERTVEDMRGNLRSAISLRGWTRERPWLMIGLSGLAGLAGGLVLAARDGARREREGSPAGECRAEPPDGRTGTTKLFMILRWAVRFLSLFQPWAAEERQKRKESSDVHACQE